MDSLRVGSRARLGVLKDVRCPAWGSISRKEFQAEDQGGGKGRTVTGPGPVSEQQSSVEKHCKGEKVKLGDPAGVFGASTS